MATYKKRGNKKKAKDLVQEQSTTAEVFSTLDKSASRTEEWVAKNQKYIFGLVGFVSVVILGYLAYMEFIQKPKETEASNELFFAQQYFDEAVNSTEKDSLYNLALNGAEGKYGLLDIIDKYKGTKAANIAKYSAGMAYLNTGNYKDAVSYLQDFSSDDIMLGALAKGGIGDAFMQLNQTEDALKYYENAFTHHNNDYLTPRFLFKAGIAAMVLKENDKALTYFKRIKEEFPDSEEGRTIDVYIGNVKS